MENKKVEVPVTVLCFAAFAFIALLAFASYLLGKSSTAGAKVAEAGRPVQKGAAVTARAVEKAEKTESREKESGVERANFLPSAFAAGSGSGKRARAGEASSSVPSSFTPVGAPAAEAEETPAVAQTSVRSRSSSSERGSGDRQDIKSFFEKTEGIMMKAKTWDDPNAAAEGMVRALMSGDSSDIDELIRSLNSVKTELEGISAPSECSEYKSALSSTLVDSVRIMEKVKKAVSTGDISELESLSQDAARLKSKTGEADRMMQEIKDKYGI